MKSWRDECGVFGIWHHSEAARLAYLGLYALQHRGQESCGIVTLDEKRQHHHHRALGLVNDSFTEEVLNSLPGHAAIGHVRYSTTGSNLLVNAQPLFAILKDGPVAVAHNGNIVNSRKLREELQSVGTIFQGTNDTEILLHLLARNNSSNFVQRLLESVARVEGAFSLVMLTDRKLIAVRDPLGFRPLSLGEFNGATVVASETCAFDLIGARYIRDIEPGEAVVIDDSGVQSFKLERSPYFGRKPTQCSFEHIYFARPDSLVFGRNVYEVRKNLGRILARQDRVEADVVLPVPDSGVPAAVGYAQESKIPFEMGIIRNHYIGRTFIEPKMSIRSFGVKIKLNPMQALLSGKRVVVIDDSIVRGTTSKKIVDLIRHAGAKEVHMRISSPMTIGPCYYGVDTPTREELIASRMNVQEIAKFIGVDSLAYLSVEGMLEAMGGAWSGLLQGLL